MNTPSMLCDILKDSIIPQAMRLGVEHIALAPPAWKGNLELPEGMAISRTAMKGSSKKIRNSRPYGSASLFNAIWPIDKLHSARAPVLCFVTNGSLAYRISNYVLHCQSGHAVLIPPGIPFADGSHRFLDDTKMHESSCTMLQMQPYHEGLFCWRTHRWLDGKGELQNNAQNSSVHGSLVPGHLYQLMDEMQRGRKFQQMICDSLLRLLLGTLYRELQDLPVFETGELVPNNRAAHSKRPIAQIEEYVHQNLARNLSIEKMTQRVYLSRTAFTQQFRAQTGKSLVEYVTDLRFEKACELLRGTDLAVEQIARAVGVEPNRLRVLFRQREGMAPSQYRHNTVKHQNKPLK